MLSYQVAVIGGGPGGYVAAIRASQLGCKTALIERDALGGTCLNRGCIPTKSLLYSAEVYEEMLRSSVLGIDVSGVTYDYARIAERKNKIVSRLSGGVEYLLKSHGVDVIRGEAALMNKTTIQVGKEVICADKIILAMGSQPAGIPIPGIERDGVTDSDGVLALEELPESVVIIGGGVVGIEFAALFGALGKKVSVIEMLPGIMGSAADSEISSTMMRVLRREKIDIHVNSKVLEIKEGLCVAYEEKGKYKEVSGNLVVVAVGRKPATSGMGLEKLGIQMERGFVRVNEYLETSVPGIYAIGDITGKIQLAHVASAQGLVASANASGDSVAMNYDVIPSCIYTNPEVACVGMTEEQARQKGIEVRIGKFATAGNGRSMVMGEQNGFAKIVADAKTGKILGAQMLCARASDMIAEIDLAMRTGADVKLLGNTIHPHPTVSEILMEAAHDVEHMCVHNI